MSIYDEDEGGAGEDGDDAWLGGPIGAFSPVGSPDYIRQTFGGAFQQHDLPGGYGHGFGEHQAAATWDAAGSQRPLYFSPLASLHHSPLASPSPAGPVPHTDAAPPGDENHPPDTEAAAAADSSAAAHSPDRHRARARPGSATRAVLSPLVPTGGNPPVQATPAHATAAAAPTATAGGRAAPPGRLSRWAWRTSRCKVDGTAARRLCMPSRAV